MKDFKRKHNKNSSIYSKGFTLIELLVVIAIIGLLSSIVFASLNQARAKARDAVRYSDIKQINTAIQLYISDHGYAPFYMTGEDTVTDTYIPTPNWSTLAAVLAPYITPLPKDPCGIKCPGANGSMWYAYEYHSPVNMDAYCGGDPTCNIDIQNSYRIYAENLEKHPLYYGFSSFGSF